MNNSLLDRAILNLAPTAEFSIDRHDDGGESVTWHSADIEKPDDAAIAAEIKRLVFVGAQDTGKKRIIDFADGLRKSLAKNPTYMEVAGWPLKLALAEKFRSGVALTDAETFRINSEIDLRGKGETIDSITNKVIVQSNGLALSVSVIDGMQSSALRACQACETEQEVIDLCKDLKTKADEQLKKLKGI
jgi:hypothetical protein